MNEKLHRNTSARFKRAANRSLATRKLLSFASCLPRKKAKLCENVLELETNLNKNVFTFLGCTTQPTSYFYVEYISVRF